MRTKSQSKTETNILFAAQGAGTPEISEKYYYRALDLFDRRDMRQNEINKMFLECLDQMENKP